MIQSTSKQKVIALVGLPASGKTRLAKILMKNADFTFVSRDKIRSAMFPDCLFTEDEKNAAYKALKIALETNLKLENSVLIDGMTFSKRKEVDEINAICGRCGVKVYFVHLKVSPETAKQRINAQTKKERSLRPDRDVELVDIVASRFEALPDFVISIDGERETETIARDIISMVS